MHDIDTFIDLEAIGVGLSFSFGGSLNVLLEQLPVTLEELGFKIRNIWGTACALRSSGRISGETQIAIKRIMVEHGGVMCWTEGVADDALNGELLRRLIAQELASNILLVADDHGFASVVERLRCAGHRVIVSGHHVSKRLRKVASTTIPFVKLIGADCTIPKVESAFPFNGILLPEEP